MPTDQKISCYWTTRWDVCRDAMLDHVPCPKHDVIRFEPEEEEEEVNP